MRSALLTLLALLASVMAGRAEEPKKSHDWPQWWGPDRSNVSKETGLLKEWPESGPKLVWKAEGLGEGVTSVAVSGGKIFTIGSKGDDEYAIALNVADGKEVWRVKIGAAPKEMAVMRWLSQRVPTIDGDRAYFVTTAGELICMESATGKERWQINYLKDLQGTRGPWGFCDYPLVDGDRLIISSGGSTATVAALDKKTGKVIWKCPAGEGFKGAHAVLKQAEIGGVNQYVHMMFGGMIGVAAKDGKLLWKFTDFSPKVAVTHAPTIRGDTIFYASGYGAGHVVVKVTRAGDELKAETMARNLNTYQPWLGCPILIGDHVFVNGTRDLICLEHATGKIVWQHPVLRSTLTAADGRLYVRDMKGKMLLVEATPEGYREKGTFTPPRTSASNQAWSFPVVSGRRLYLRDMDLLLCYDVAQAPRPDKKPRQNAGIFVPTPPDVVVKMLDLAGVKKNELVCDLGCGDGRILVTAATKYGARGWGIDNDKECVKMAQQNVAEAKVGDRVTIAAGDLFDADFSKADVVALFLLPEATAKLVPKFEKLRPGARIVSHAFLIPGLKPDRVVSVKSDEDELERKLYLYKSPFMKP